VHIPIDDLDAFSFNPDHRWVYNKFLVAQSQGVECGQHDVEPAGYPVFCKPMMNLEGSGTSTGSHVLDNVRDYREYCRPGDFWMRLLTGDHVSTDFAVVNGKVSWCRHTLGLPDGAKFDYWVVEERVRPRLEKYCADWIDANLPTYAGMVNLESIGGRIIGAHLRFADQWPDLYGRKWLDALIRLYRSRTWDLVDTGRAEAYSVVLFGPHGSPYAYPHPDLLASCRATVGISSIHLRQFDDQPLVAPAAPLCGVRLAVINSFNLDVGLRVRAAIARAFGLQDVNSAKTLQGNQRTQSP
jgi:hypothetical protein